MHDSYGLCLMVDVERGTGLIMHASGVPSKPQVYDHGAGDSLQITTYACSLFLSLSLSRLLVKLMHHSYHRA